jgi:protein-glutamine gamma-glutamyltransferase
VERVQYYFAQGYQYATFQKSVALTGSPMVDFLHRSKAGHCEYFATATALLLRAGGIPARYATGFAVSEKSERKIAHESAYIVRQRHAHAWVRAYVNGVWVDVDTTPPSWIAAEAAGSGAWTRVTDYWAWVRFRASQAWAGSSERQLLTAALVVTLPFALWLLWLLGRLYRSRRAIRNNQLNQLVTALPRAGMDSEFYRVEQRLTEQGWGRHAHETASDWLTRLKGSGVDSGALAEIVNLHTRYRFDPQPLSRAQRARLTQAAHAWLAAHVPPPVRQ